MKLVTGPQAAREKEVELRLEPSSWENGVHVRMYENGLQVPSGRLGCFRQVDGKIEFERAAGINEEYAHMVNYELKCV